ncbi:atp-dependent helicase [Methylobacterium sp. J-072]|uniref:atp-dependent helicase n=1 Tax=Methylobacterium sp. J-072 TaxID=2836651 RepID=UPI001FB8FF19|nr:atp-dependent helicase [Methylobacterium sp. J-072]MCJ2096211.1 atp-dependent helicase [Methylobacterium sp. J-072]
MLTEPAVDVTGDGMIAQELLNDLRAAQAKLEAAREDAASLKVLLALRTHQHDLAWQDVQRLTAELEATRARTSALEADLAEARTSAASADAVAEADERTEAVRAVLGAVLDSIGGRALDRRRFQEIIARAGREAPTDGPGAARHAVLLTEARRVLGIPG